MKMRITLLLIGLFVSSGWGGVSLQVYRADGQTPLAWADPNEPDIYEDIMVGTHLIFIIGSDTPVVYWDGGLLIPWDDWALGTITGRQYNPKTRNYDGSILPTNVDAYVAETMDDQGIAVAFSIMDFDFELIAGEWFIVDYCARQVGTCIMGLYSSEPAVDTDGDLLSVPLGDAPANQFWVQGLSFHHVPSRDYDGDTVVNFVDFALWAEQWQQAIVAEDPNAVPPGDLDADAFVDTADLALFTQYWLERTDIAAPAEPNALAPNTPETAL